MRLHFVLGLALIGSIALAREPRHYQTGKLMRMESVKCGTDAKDAKKFRRRNARH